MFVSDDKKVIFIHIFKTGGNSIRVALKKHCKVTKSHGAHCKAAKGRSMIGGEKFNDYYSFAITRNPWDWLVSHYYYILRARNHRRHKLIKGLSGFPDYVQLRKDHGWNTQKSFIVDGTGNPIINYVGRAETIQTDFDIVCKESGLPQTSVPRKNKTPHPHYTKCHNKKTIQLVEDMYAEDIEMFGYTYTGLVEGELLRKIR